MNKRLLDLYKQYASSETSRAVIFVKEHLEKSNGHWVDIIECKRIRDVDFHNADGFSLVLCGLFKRKLQPKYPDKSQFMRNGKFDERAYYFMVRAITWETANLDIEQQKDQHIQPLKYKIIGNIVNLNAGQKGYFIDTAPPEIKALAKNLLDKTNPLWDIAMGYINEPKYEYKIRSIKQIN